MTRRTYRTNDSALQGDVREESLADERLIGADHTIQQDLGKVLLLLYVNRTNQASFLRYTCHLQVGIVLKQTTRIGFAKHPFHKTAI